jgi:hypothetical protein
MLDLTLTRIVTNKLLVLISRKMAEVGFEFTRAILLLL